jgi:hypothetical protein
MTAEEILLRDAFLLSMELKIYWFVAFLYGASFIAGIIYLFSSNLSAGRLLTFGLYPQEGC